MFLNQFFGQPSWEASADSLPALGAASDRTTVSGLSSGGFMAVQLHVAYSDVIKGAGIFAGGPFYCAQDKEMTALTSCMSSPMMISDMTLEKDTDQFVSSNSIADTANLKDQHVYMFSGKEDKTVRTGVMDALQDYYKHYNVDVTYETSIDANHAVPTDLERNKNACDYLGSPYINNCNYDGVGAMYASIYDQKLKTRDLDWESKGKIVEFDQTEFITGNSMDDTGFVYIPNGCQDGSKKCAVHVALHGCKQGATYVQESFVKDAGYLEWASTNDIITLFPQATHNMMTNPQGCWDWWGYTNDDYAVKDGPQMKAIMDMVDRMMEQPTYFQQQQFMPSFPALGGFGNNALGGMEGGFGGLETIFSLVMTLVNFFFGF